MLTKVTIVATVQVVSDQGQVAGEATSDPVTVYECDFDKIPAILTRLNESLTEEQVQQIRKRCAS